MTRHHSPGRAGGRVTGLVTASVAVAAFGIAPLATAPSGDADAVDAVLDQILSPLLDPATGGVDFNAPGALSAEAPSLDLSALFDQQIHPQLQNWIDSDLGKQVDAVLNAPFLALTGRTLIGDGTAGTVRSPRRRGRRLAVRRRRRGPGRQPGRGGRGQRRCRRGLR